MADIALQHAVQALLDELVADGDEVGLQAVVMKDGALVADAQSGVADPASGEPVSAGTLFFAGSTAKGVLSSLVHALVAAGRLDYDLRLGLGVARVRCTRQGERDRATCPHAPGRRARPAA